MTYALGPQPYNQQFWGLVPLKNAYEATLFKYTIFADGFHWEKMSCPPPPPPAVLCNVTTSFQARVVVFIEVTILHFTTFSASFTLFIKRRPEEK